MRTRITMAVSMLAGALRGGAESMEALQRWRKSPRACVGTVASKSQTSCSRLPTR
jgi:hypothetical protein